MRDGWKTVCLEDVAKVVNGGTPKTNVPEFWGGEHLWITPAEMSGLDSPYLSDSRRKLTDSGLQGSSASLVPENSVILSTRAPIGHLVINDKPMAFNQGCRGIVVGEGAFYKFVYYFLLSNVELLNDLGSGATFKELSAGKLKRVTLPLPTLKEQKRVVAILDEAFEGIDTVFANTKKNLSNARELFDSSLHLLLSSKAERWTSSKIGEMVDKGILKKPLDGNHGAIHPKKADYVVDGVPFVMAADLIDGGVDQTGCNFISREQADSLRKGFALDGDVLLSHKGTIGRAAVLETQHDYVMLTPQVTYYRVADRSAIYNRFLYYAFQSPDFVREIKHVAGAGSTRAYIGITKQLDLPLSYPCIETQQEIVSKLDSISEEARRLQAIYQQKLTALAELKQSLLQKAFSGELTAREAEAAVEEATA